MSPFQSSKNQWISNFTNLPDFSRHEKYSKTPLGPRPKSDTCSSVFFHSRAADFEILFQRAGTRRVKNQLLLLSGAADCRPILLITLSANIERPENNKTSSVKKSAAKMSSEKSTASGILSGSKNIIAGGCGGICVVLSGHPFDTVKVRKPVLKHFLSVRLFKKKLCQDFWYLYAMNLVLHSILSIECMS